MAVTRERFAQGMTYEQYKEQMTRNRERFEANERDLRLEPADLAPFEVLARPLNVLVIAEDWCGDVIDNLPILGGIAARTGKLNLRVFLRDQHPDLIDQYLNQGQFRSIPVFAFFDEDFTELGRFIERPASVSARRANQRREVAAEHPEFGDPATPIAQVPEEVRAQLMQALADRRAASRGDDVRDVARELGAIVAKA
jgi:hypothetical protein